MEQQTYAIHLVVFTTICTISVLGLCKSVLRITLTKESYIAYFFFFTVELTFRF